MKLSDCDNTGPVVKLDRRECRRWWVFGRHVWRFVRGDNDSRKMLLAARVMMRAAAAARLNSAARETRAEASSSTPAHGSETPFQLEPSADGRESRGGGGGVGGTKP